MTPTSITRPRSSAASLAISHPLDEFYARMGLTLPPLEQVDGEAVPQPYRQLLVHHNDMTPTLEKFHQHDIHLRLLGRRHRGDEYFREVVLLLDGTNQAVEFGATAHFKVDGPWNDDLMVQVKAPAPIPSANRLDSAEVH